MESFYAIQSSQKGLLILLSRTQAGPGRTGKQEQEQISRNHVQTIFGTSDVEMALLVENCHRGRKEIAAVDGLDSRFSQMKYGT